MRTLLIFSTLWNGGMLTELAGRGIPNFERVQADMAQG
jgi:hypothetical protein